LLFKKKDLRSFEDLTQHFTTRAADNHATPDKSLSLKSKIGKVYAYYRINPHVPLLVLAPVNSFEFHFCKRTLQAVCFVLT